MPNFLTAKQLIMKKKQKNVKTSDAAELKGVRVKMTVTFREDGRVLVDVLHRKSKDINAMELLGILDAAKYSILTK